MEIGICGLHVISIFRRFKL